MRRIAVLLLAASACAPIAPRNAPAPIDEEHPRLEWGMVLHGGAGVTRTSYTAAELPLMQATFQAALRAGHAILERGGSSLDAVEAAVRILEDDSLFNAGRGAVFTNDSINELDAAIMEGHTYRAGAVAGLHRVKNPITLARAVMERSKHVMMIGDGAERFAAEHGIELVDPSWFRTGRRMRSLRQAIERERRAANPGGSAVVPDPTLRFGTVGAVALDKQGRLAAATTTGGMTNKRYGRVGDVPIIGAGTYASPTCAVSATGDGEYFIRWSIAHSICARTELAGMSLASAADTVIMHILEATGGEGGVISLDSRGHVAMPFNAEGMTRGYVGPDGRTWMKMFR
ncbi:MAG: isoaspartyl peptidase/L-asparaginase [Gemmatimonadaceae bacterium]